MDKTTDITGKFVANMVVQTLNENKSRKNFLLRLKN